jgi:hypothetical protein
LFKNVCCDYSNNLISKTIGRAVIIYTLVGQMALAVHLGLDQVHPDRQVGRLEAEHLARPRNFHSYLVAKKLDQSREQCLYWLHLDNNAKLQAGRPRPIYQALMIVAYSLRDVASCYGDGNKTLPI